jgi:phospholipase/carboxylesterase
MHFHHLIRQPKLSNKKPKALLMLHGFGSNEADLMSFSDHLHEDLLIISARAPYSLPFGGYAWYDIQITPNGAKISDNHQAEKSLHLLGEYIDKLIDIYQIDPDNFNLMGFSQGAILSYALTFWYPEKIKNIVALSGYINEEIMPLYPKIDSYRHLNIFVSHGIYDEIIPIEAARKIPPYLNQHKISHTYNEYNMGHEVSYECFQDILQWINLNF